MSTTTRKPMFLLRLFGLFLLREAERTFLWLLLNEPPRSSGAFEPDPATAVLVDCHCLTVW